MSGRFVVRMPSSMHEQLAARAKEEGVSLNHLIVALLAGAIGFDVADANRTRGPVEGA